MGLTARFFGNRILAKAMEGQDFNREHNLDSARFNRVLWTGLMGEDVPYPTERQGRDLSVAIGGRC